jgi:hypothetical protein
MNILGECFLGDLLTGESAGSCGTKQSFFCSLSLLLHLFANFSIVFVFGKNAQNKSSSSSANIFSIQIAAIRIFIEKWTKIMVGKKWGHKIILALPIPMPI